MSAALDKARRTLEAARYLLAGGFYGESVARAYYAAFYAARAAVEARGASPHLHSGVLTVFGQRFVSTGEVAFDVGRVLRSLQDQRHVADYDDGADVTEQAARTAVEQAGLFIEAIAGFLGTSPA